MSEMSTLPRPGKISADAHDNNVRLDSRWEARVVFSRNPSRSRAACLLQLQNTHFLQPNSISIAKIFMVKIF